MYGSWKYTKIKSYLKDKKLSTNKLYNFKTYDYYLLT